MASFKSLDGLGLKPEDLLCYRCVRRAEIVLFNQRDALVGHYCRSCGHSELERQRRQEAERAIRQERR